MFCRVIFEMEKLFFILYVATGMAGKTWISLETRRVARGGSGGNCPPPIPKVELNISKLIKLLTCKTNK